MGAYATTTSLSELMPNYLAGNTTTSDTSATNQFSRHIDRAESTVQAYVARLYSMPFSPVPPVIRTLSEDIACYYALRSSFTQDGMSKNPFYEAYKVAMETLEKISKGEIKLADTAGSLLATQASNRYLSSTEGYTPIFGRDDPTDWQRDQNEIDDQEAARGG